MLDLTQIELLTLICNIINTHIIGLITMAYVIAEIKSKRIHKQGDIINNTLNSKRKNFWSSSRATKESNENNEDQKSGDRDVRWKIQSRRERNYYQKVSRFLNTSHIYNFLDYLCINQQTMKNSNHDESILKTVFYSRSIYRVENDPSGVSLFLKSTQNPSNVSYIIERFNSFGDAFFHSVANYLQTIHSIWMLGHQQKIKHTDASDREVEIKQSNSISQIRSRLKGKPYFLKILPNHMIFSKELIELVGNNVENFSKDCLLYKSIVDDIFTSENYRFLLESSLKYLLKFAEVRKGRMTLQELIKSSALQFYDSLRCVDDRRIRVKTKAFMPTPSIYCMLVDEVYQYEDTPYGNLLSVQEQRAQYAEEWHAQNKKTITSLTESPNKLKINQETNDKRCSYIPKPRRKKGKKIEYDYEI